MRAITTTPPTAAPMMTPRCELDFLLLLLLGELVGWEPGVVGPEPSDLESTDRTLGSAFELVGRLMEGKVREGKVKEGGVKEGMVMEGKVREVSPSSVVVRMGAGELD